jgi:enediyne biosynthesis protein E4
VRTLLLRIALLAALGIFCVFPTAGCLGTRAHAPGVATDVDRRTGGLVFRDVTLERGIDFRIPAAEDPGRLNILQISAGGAAFLDYDGDGRLDILLLGLGQLALYRQTETGHFTDATREAGLDPAGAWMGCATGDFNNSGYLDLLLTGYHEARLYRNDGGRFTDISAECGIVADRWYTSAAFADIDNDGLLDLYLAGYADYTPQSVQYCPVGISPDGVMVSGPCGPEPYGAVRGKLYRNVGNDRFVEITLESGLATAAGKTLGVAFADFDGDGWIDLYLANDRVPCDLFRNEGGGRFRNIGTRSGTAFNRDGEVQGGMGVAWGDFDNDGLLDLFVATYQSEPKSLYRNEEKGLFRDVSLPNGLAPANPYVAFGAGLVDFDNDGWLDLFLANGHVLGPVEQVDPSLSFRQPLQLFHNRGDGSFAEVPEVLRQAGAHRMVGRAAAFGDFDNDGRCDVLIADGQGRPVLLRNESETANHWLRVELVGAQSNRQGIGARVTVRTEDGRSQLRHVATGSSYLAASDPRLLVGLGSAGRVESVEVQWPGRGITTVRDPEINRDLVIHQKPAARASKASPSTPGARP